MKNFTKIIFGSLVLLLISTSSFAQPANNSCGGAQVITPDGTCVAGTTVAATDEWSGTVGCQAGGGTHEDVWYTFVSTGTVFTGTLTTSAPTAGTMEFTLVSSATGCLGPFTIVGSACGAAPLAINITGLTNGATYYFTVSNASAGTPGPFSICSTTSSPAASCVDNDDCASPQVVTYTTGVQTCIADCNTGAAPGPDFAGNNCQDFPNSTVWYQVTTGANSASINIQLTSGAMSTPYFSVFTTANCSLFTTVNCTQGAAGSASATVPVAVLTTYLIAVSDASGASGNFNLCITVNDDNSACNTNNSLTVSATSMGSPLTGPFQPGELVTFCYSITDWTQFNCNWLQGIVPTFGNGWDPASFNAQGMPINITTPLTTQGVIQPCGPGPPCAWNGCVGTPSGTWSWFPAGAVTYNNIAGSLPPNSPMPGGWYFLSSYNPATGACNGGDPTDPDNSFGDGNWNTCGTNTMDWQVCFRLQVRDATACTSGQTNLSVTVNTYADGEIGTYNSVGCTADASGAPTFPASICCTAAPTVTTPVTYCLNQPASQLTATGTGLLWYTTATGGVGSATAPTPSTAVAGTTNYYVSSTSGGCESARTIISVVVNAIPATPTAGNNGPLCVGSALNLTSNTVGSATYSWTGPNAFTSAVEDPSVSGSATVAMSGTYSVTVTVNGCTSPAGTTTVTVNPVPAMPTAGNNGPVCVGSALNLTSNTVGSATYSWTGPNAFTSALEDPSVSASATVAMAGTYSVTVTVAGCTSPVGTTTVVVNTIPSIPTAGNNGPVCAGSALNLTSSTIASATYSWTGPNGFTSAVEDPSVSASATAAMAGTYSVTATVNGCTSAAGTTTVVVNPIPATPTAGNNGPVCVGTALNLTSNTVGSATYSWTGPNGFTSSLEDPTVSASATVAMAGTYSVTVTVSGCTSAAGTTTVVVNTIPSAPTAGNNGPLCEGAALNLTATTVASAIYSWTGPNAFTSAVEDPTVSASSTVAMSGTYSVTVTVSGCTSIAGTTTVTVNPIPVMPTAGNNGPVCTGSGLDLTSGTVGGATYSWTGPNGFTSSSEDPTVSASATTAMAGTYSVTVTVAGCTSVAGTTTVIVNTLPAYTTTAGNPTTCGGTNGSLTLSGLTASTTYNIGYLNGATPVGPLSLTSDASGNIIISGLSQGSYSNILVELSGCTTTDAGPFVLTDPGASTFTVASTNPTTCGGTDGTITLSGLTASTSYNVTYTNGATPVGPTAITSDASGNILINGLSQGSYTNVTVELAGCSTTNAGPHTLTDPAAPVFTVASTNPTTCGGTEGTITLSGLTASTSYNVTYTNGAATVGPTAMTSDASGNILINGLSQGSYTNVTVELTGCSTTSAGPYTLTDPAPPVFTVSSTNPSACGGTDGTLTLSGLTVSTSYSVTYTNGVTVVGPVTMTSDAFGDLMITGLSQGSYTNIIASISGCNTTDAGTYTLSDPGSPVFAVTSSNPTTCGGTDGSLTLTGLTASTSYNVTYSNGATVVGPTSMTTNASGNIVITGLSQGAYSNIIVSLAGCNTTDAGPYTLTDPAAPVFTVVAANPTTCGGSDGTLTLSGLTAATGYNIAYLNGATVVGPALMTTDASGNIVITGLSQGSYSNIVVSLAGCNATDAGPYVLVTPTAPPAPTASGAAYCQGATINSVTASGTGGTFNWYDDAALTILLSSNATYTPTNVVTDTFYVTETIGICTSPATPVIITINPLPTANAGPAQPIGCGITGAILDGSLSSTGATITYNWTTTSGNIVSGVGSITPTVDAAGSYTVTVTNTATGCSSVDSVLVIAAPAPVASFTANPMTGTSPLPVDFTNTSTLSNTYVWNFGDGSALVSATDPSYVFTAPGTYNVTLIASNNNSCPDTVTATIVVFDNFTVVIPNVFTPNGDNNNDQFKVTSTGVESLRGEIYDRWGLKIYDWSHVNEGWDGRTQSGVPVVDGTYYYIITIKGQDGKEHLYKGFVQLLSK